MINNCPGCGQTPQGPHRPDCPTVLLAEQFYSSTNLKPGPVFEKNEAEYRRVWLEVAMRLFVDPSPNALPTIGHCFSAADAFLAELKKRDNQKES